MTDKPVTTHRRVRFKDIPSSAWEHPADRAALIALKAVPGLDALIKAVLGQTTEKSLRLLTLASSVRVNEKQFPKVYAIFTECCEIFGIEEKDRPELFISQSPILNAGAIGVEQPFITLNSSMVSSMSDEELMAVIGHELGHILSGHLLYKTLLIIMIQLSVMISNIPLGGIAVGSIVAALKEWDRKSELTADRAGLLAVQDPEVSIHLLMKLAGGNHLEQMNLGEFIKQAEEYENNNSAVDNIHKILNAIGKTHPFPVTRLNELMKWVQRGEYDGVLRGFYGEPGETTFGESAQQAAKGYKDDLLHMASPLIDQAKETAEKAKDFFGLGNKTQEDKQ